VYKVYINHIQKWIRTTDRRGLRCRCALNASAYKSDRRSYLNTLRSILVDSLIVSSCSTFNTARNSKPEDNRKNNLDLSREEVV
jgi:collagenase-like PrtC family protease